MNNQDQNFDINSICQNINNDVMNATKNCNAIASSYFNFYINSNQFSKVMQKEGNTAMNLLSQIVNREQAGKKSLNKINDDDDKFESLCEINDFMFDKIGNSLDDAEGLKKKDADLVMATLNVQNNSTQVTNVSSWNRELKKKHFGQFNLLSANSITRPQLKFKDKIDNSNTPFVPKISEKPNSIKPLAVMPETDEHMVESYCHPYEVELEKFRPPESFFQLGLPKMPKPITETTYKFISTKKDLLDLLQDLKSCKEFAVDLEHHSYRTFQGFTCLMQISTYSFDYLVDTLELRNELYILNEVFTSPNILKVFHGADMDIVWLQRDFGLYVVNLFDTGQAAKLLNFAHLSLAFLLKHYCNIETDKKFQLADWRIRPLTQEMINYAIEDTHYLLYVYNKIKNELIAKGNSNNNLLLTLFDRCKAICLKKYEKPIFSPESYKTLIRKNKINLNLRQEYAVKELFAWRDKIARNQDESYGYVLPNHMLLKIAEVLPREQQGILACCNPIPTLVKQQLNEIHMIILKARDLPLSDKNEDKTQYVKLKNIQSKVVDLDENAFARHDTFHLDNEQHLPTLLDSDYSHSITKNVNTENGSPLFRMFSKNKKLNEIDKITTNFISPFQRYQSSQKEIEDKGQVEKK